MQSSYFELWDKFIVERDKFLSSFEFENQTEKFILVLYARINSLSEELIFLAKNSWFTSSQILMRSILETYIDLKCLVDDDSFVDVLIQAERESEIKCLQNFDSNNKYYGLKYKEYVKNRLEKLNKASNKKISINMFQKFEKAEELDSYRTVYNDLCRFTHGNVIALASKHFESGKIKLNKSISNREFTFILSASINIAIASSIEVLEKFSFKKQDISFFRGIIDDVNEIAKKERT